MKKLYYSTELIEPCPYGKNCRIGSEKCCSCENCKDYSYRPNYIACIADEKERNKKMKLTSKQIKKILEPIIYGICEMCEYSEKGFSEKPCCNCFSEQNKIKSKFSPNKEYVDYVNKELEKKVERN